LMDTGFIKLWRKFMEWGWYSDANTKSLFLHLLLISNHKDSAFLGQDVKRGQCIIGRKTLAKTLGMSEQSIRTALTHLKSTSEVTIKVYNKFSIATILKYHDYQVNNQQINQQPTSNQPAINQQLTTSKECKNVRMKEYKKGEGVPHSLEEVTSYFTELGYPLEANKFFDYFSSNGWRVGGKTPMKDWKAAARNWCRRLPPLKTEEEGYKKYLKKE